MDIQEALNLAGALKSRYQIFEKLEEVISHAAQAANLAVAKQREYDDLEADLETLRGDRDQLKVDISDLTDRKKGLQEDVDSLQREADFARAELADELEQSRKDAAAEAATKRQETADDLVLFERASEMTKRSLRDEISTLEGKRNAIAEALAQALQPVKPASV